MRDAGDDTSQQRSISPAILWIVQRAESQTIHGRHRPRAHREYIAQDAADTRRRPLKRLDERRVIMRFDLERGTPAIPDIDNAGILSRRHNDALAGYRQS